MADYQICTPAEDDAERRQFRTALGHYPTGVAVVTALAPSGEKIGLTINSFASLSLHPPMVLFCIGERQLSAPVFQPGVRVVVNFLAAGQAAVARQFSRSASDKFAGIAYEAGSHGVPVLAGTVGWLDCTIIAIHPTGDHAVVICAVERFAHLPEAAPLVYHRSHYTEVKEPVHADI